MRLRIFATPSEIATPFDVLHGTPLKKDRLLFEELVLAVSTQGPAYVEIANLGELAPAPRVRLELEPTDNTTRIWAFVSVTNNATQHVTVLVPR